MATPRKNTLASLTEKKNEESKTTSPEEVETISPAPETEMAQGTGEVIEQEKPVEQNPDGVTFSGRENPIGKTPAEMAAETPEESAKRFGISDEVPQSVLDDPNVQVYADDKNYQIAAGTHLHPDVAKDNYNRSLDLPNQATATTRTVVDHVYAGEAILDDKGRAGIVEEEFDRDEDYTDEEDQF